ncbi:MAG TPA: translation elongation factor Ts [Pantanalinema sp.]
MDISASLVKDLREKTGAGMMDCKKALTEVGGDLDKAVELLRKKGLAAAAKKAGRIASEGAVGSYLTADGRVGALVEVNCETDFVARNEEFVAFVKDVAQQAAEKATTETGVGADLLAQPSVAEAGQTLNEVLNTKVAKIGEKIDIRRFARYTAEGTNLVGTYIHLGGKIGVLIELISDKDISTSGDAQELARDLAMQVAASSPAFVSRTEVPAEQTEAERRILSEQDEIKAKPEAVRGKIVEGRINKYFEQVCLLEQPFIKEPGKSVTDVINERASKLGAKMSVKRFARFVLGEGIEKKVEDFAAEVAAQMGK